MTIPTSDERPFHPNTAARLRSAAATAERDCSIFVVSITDRCNIACDFCCHPYMNSDISLEDAQRLVIEALDEDFDEIGITGGEPFLRKDALLALARITAAHGRLFGVITNGYWAGNPRKADRIIGELVQAGLTRLTVSWDPSHGGFVPVRSVQNALEAALHHGIKIVLTGSFKDRDRTHEDYGFDLKELRKYRNFSSNTCWVAPAGNGRQLRDLPGSEGLDFETSACRCPGGKLHELVVYARGGLTQPCCSIYAGYKMQGMSLGDWRGTSIADLRTRQKGDPFFTIASEGGLRRIYEIIKEEDGALYDRMPDPGTAASTCELCSRLMSGRLADDVRQAAENHLLRKITADFGSEKSLAAAEQHRAVDTLQA